MVTPGLAVHRSIIAVDIEGFSDPARTLPHQLGTRAALYIVVEEALRTAGVRWDQCHIEYRGDAVFILVPPDIPKALAGRSRTRSVGAGRTRPQPHEPQHPCESGFAWPCMPAKSPSITTAPPPVPSGY